MYIFLLNLRKIDKKSSVKGEKVVLKDNIPYCFVVKVLGFGGSFAHISTCTLKYVCMCIMDTHTTHSVYYGACLCVCEYSNIYIFAIKNYFQF